MPEAKDPSSEDRQDLLRLQNELTKADLEDRHGALIHVEDDAAFTPEMEAAFLERVRAVEAEGDEHYVSVGELLGDAPYPPFEEVADATEAGDAQAAERAVDQLLQLLLERGVASPQPEWITPLGFYHFLTHDLLDHRIPPPTALREQVAAGAEQSHVIGVMYAQVRRDGPDYMLAVTEAFLLDLLAGGQPFTGETLAHHCRNGGEVGTREETRRTIQAWKDRWTSTTPVGFAPDRPFRAEDGALYFQFACKYRATERSSGRELTFEGPGLTQLALEDGEWRIVGCAMEGFEM